MRTVQWMAFATAMGLGACGQAWGDGDDCADAQGGGGGAPPVGGAACDFHDECPAQGTKQEGHDACDDGDAKTADRCVPVAACGGVCAHVSVQCDSLDPVSVHQEMCDDAEECTIDRCAGDNVCAHLPQNDGLPCANGICLAGVCVD